MKKLKILLLILITFSFLIPLIHHTLNNNQLNVEKKPQKTQNCNNNLKSTKNLKPSKIWENFTFIHITGANWSKVASKDWCTGSGTLEDPFIIKNIIINAGSSGSGILIENSIDIYFEIKNCTVYNSESGLQNAGIKLYNTTNGKLINNKCWQNNLGIFLSESDNNTVVGNTAHNNILFGIYLVDSDNNTVVGNTAYKNGQYGIRLINSDNNSISGNIAYSNSLSGIDLFESHNNTVSRNIAYLHMYGLTLQLNSSDNIIWGNLIKLNQYYGIFIISGKNNLIYFNSIKPFFGEHAKDDGINNQWDNLGIGNYWKTHKSSDSNNDGILDDSYMIGGTADSEDNYPLIESPVHDGERIHIDDSGLGAWNWSKTAKFKLWCSGAGISTDPYIIQDLIITTFDWISSILIENSNVYFRMENCQVSNTRSAIKLYNTTNGKIINNDCFLNKNGITLDQSNNNNISGNTVKNNDFGIYLENSHNNTISENNANNNDYGIGLSNSDNNTISENNGNNNYCGIGLINSNNNTISGNNANDNEYGIGLVSSDNNTVCGNTVNNNVYGIYLLESNNNSVSRNILVLNIFFIEEDECIENLIKKDNRCYTIILPSGINEVKIEPYKVDAVDVGMGIALNHETEVIFSAFNENNIEDAPIDNGLIFMNLWLNDTNNLDQSIDAPINFILDYDSKRYIPLNVFWFNESANDGQGAWKELSFTDLSNGKIVISVNHTSIFAITGLIIPIPSSSSNSDDEIYDFFFLFLIVFICSLTIVTASSTYYHKTRIQTRTKLTEKEADRRKPLAKSFDKKVVKSQNLKDYVENKNVLKFLKEKNALENLDLFDDLNLNFIPNELWEKIAVLEQDDKEKKEFIKYLLSIPNEEKQEVIDEMLKLIESNSENPNQQEYP